jgi:hypothetical protein
VAGTLAETGFAAAAGFAAVIGAGSFGVGAGVDGFAIEDTAAGFIGVGFTVVAGVLLLVDAATAEALTEAVVAAAAGGFGGGGEDAEAAEAGADLLDALPRFSPKEKGLEPELFADDDDSVFAGAAFAGGAG